MCGQEHIEMSSHEADTMVLKVHNEMPKDYPILKGYLIDRCKFI